MEKTLAIIIGLVAGVALIIVLLSALNKLFEKKGLVSGLSFFMVMNPS